MARASSSPLVVTLSAQLLGAVSKERLLGRAVQRVTHLAGGDGVERMEVRDIEIGSGVAFETRARRVDLRQSRIFIWLPVARCASLVPVIAGMGLQNGSAVRRGFRNNSDSDCLVAQPDLMLAGIEADPRESALARLPLPLTWLTVER